MVVNPEFNLDVRDTTGNPPRRDQIFFRTSS
jgi:hypothetical protein